MADPGSEERGGGARGFGGFPTNLLVNASQFRGLFKVFGENKGALARCAPPPPLDPPLIKVSEPSVTLPTSHLILLLSVE